VQIKNRDLQKLNRAILKKAMGYQSQEVVEEYTKNIDGELELVKRKVSKKQNSPDIAAAKLIAELKEDDSLEEMTLEQLQAEREKLLNLLNQDDA
jgi:hypothetical protein